MTDQPNRHPRSGRLFRLLLYAYPNDVRQQCSAEMWEIFSERLAETRHRGGLAVVRLWVAEIAAALASGYRERHSRRLRRLHQGDWTMESVLEDVRYGIRTLIKSRGFTAVAALTLALGIGANTTIFTMVSGVLFFPFGFDEPERAMQIRTIGPDGDQFVLTSVPEFVDWKDQAASFEFMAASQATTFNLTGGAEPVRVSGVSVTTDYFSVFSVEPEMGRGFIADEDRPGAEPVTIITQSLWDRQMGSDPSIIGGTLMLDGVAHTVIGVLPEDFVLGIGVDLYVPLTLDLTDTERGVRSIVVSARLAADVSPDEARAELTAIATRVASDYPVTNMGWRIEAPTWPELLRSGNMGIILIMFQVAVLFVLLIGCANVSNLMLARMSSRTSEVSIRVAMGAGRWRLVRQFLTEGVILSILGGIGGLMLSYWGVAYMRGAFASAPGVTLLARTMQIDWKILLFTLSVSIASTLVFGLLPAWRGSRTSLHGTLKEGGHRSGGGAHNGLRNVLVFSEVAMAGVLLISAGILINSVIKVRMADPGFNLDDVLTMRASLSENEHPDDAQVRSFYREAVEAIAAVPGVEMAGATSQLPVTLGGFVGVPVAIEGRPLDLADRPAAVAFTITTEYLQLMDIALLEGRYLSSNDTPRTIPVALVSYAMARRYWPDGDAIGQRLSVGRVDATDGWTTIVGIVEDVRNDDIDEPPVSKVYRPHAQNPVRTMALAARTSGEPPLALATDMRTAVGRIDPNLPVFDIQTVRQVVDAEAAADFVLLQIFGAFAVFALVLSSVGVYSVMSYSVSERTHEIGVRMALGAQAENIYGQIIGQGMKITLAGLVVGLAGGYGVGVIMTTLSPLIDPTDPMAFAPITATLVFVALLACYIPARRAASVDPNVALRHE